MEATLICKSCNNRVPLSDLKADKTGLGWICLKCYQSQHPNIYKQQKEKLLSRTEQITSKLQRIKYYCSECSYKFQKEGKYTGKCPYCNLYTIKEDKDAATLLREVTEEDRAKPRIEILED